MNYLERFQNWGSGVLGNQGSLDTGAGYDWSGARTGSLAGSTDLMSQGGFDPSFMQKLTGYTDGDGIKTAGWGGLALGATQGILGAYSGMKQFGLAKDSLKESKRQFNLNYGAQKQTLNTQLADRQNARVASNPNAYQSVSEYMAQNRIK